MKNLLNTLSLAGLLLLGACGGNHESKVTAATVEKQFKVWGNCEQCKATIEKATQLPGVNASDWSDETNILKVKLDTTQTSADAVLKAVADAGYDNERFRANDAAYANLPECCQYERKPAEH